MAQYWKVVRNFSPGIIFYTLALAAIGFAYFGVASVLFNLFLLRLGFGLDLIGQVNGIGQLTWALMAVPASLIGRLGLRRVVVGGSLLIGFGYILFLLVNLLPESWQVTWLFVTTILIWVGAAFVTVNGLPLLSSACYPEERTHAIAISSAISSVMAILGSLAAGLIPGWVASLAGANLTEPGPYQASFWVVPFAFILSAFFYNRVKSVPQTIFSEEQSTQSPVPLFIFLFFGVVVFFQTASEGGLRAFYNVYLDTELSISTAQIGLIFAVGGILPILGSLVMPPLVGRFGSARTLGLVALGMSGFLVFTGFYVTPIAAIIGFIGLNFLGAIAGATRSALSQEIVVPRWHGVSSAIVILGLALGWASMSVVGGMVMGTVRFGGLMYLSAASALISTGLIAGYLLAHRPRRKAVAESK